MKRLMLKSIAAAVAIAALGAASAQEIKEHTIKFAHQNPAGHPIVMGMEKFAEIVKAKSGGKIKVNLFPGGVLGSDQANVSALQGGTLEMVVLNTGILASQVKELSIFDFPFLFTTTKEADAIVDGPVGKKMHAKLEEKGIVGLSYWELGFRNMTNSKRPLNKVEDIAGLKLRVIPNPINVDWVKALDANPTPLPFPEVYAAMEQKAIDGHENPVTVINANKFYEVQKYIAMTGHSWAPLHTCFNMAGSASHAGRSPTRMSTRRRSRSGASCSRQRCTKLAGSELAAMVMGARVPCILSSRGDSTQTKLYSIALAALAAK